MAPRPLPSPRRRRPLAPTGLARALALTLGLAWTACAPGHARGRQGRAPREAAAIEYAVTIPRPLGQVVEVDVIIRDPLGDAEDLAMPAWTPGSYVIRDHARNLEDLAAETLDGAPLTVERRDKQTWRIRHGRRPFRVHYRVYADELGVRTSHVDDRHASLIGASIFLYRPGARDRPIHLRVDPPPGWSVHTALASAGARSFTASDYDELIDAPLELGTPALRSFTSGALTVEVVFTAPTGANVDLDRLTGDLKAIVDAFGAMMGGFPLRRYVFLIHAAASSGGGLEHAASSSLLIRRDQFASDEGYRRFAHLAAHEFFHLWNVKRLRDRALVPHDLAGEDYTTMLWFHEGFTETMENLALVRAGIVDQDAHLRDLASTWSAYQARPARNHRPIGEHSFDAWIKGYKPSPHQGRTLISYYEKGSLIGAALDLELRLRAAKHGQQGSLAGLFRRLMAGYDPRRPGIGEAEVIAAASAEAGEPMDAFFAEVVAGRREVPLPALLAKIGVKVEARAPWDAAELSPQARARARAFTGVTTSQQKVVDLIEGSPAAAVLMIGDEIIAVADQRIRSDAELRERLADHPVGAEVELDLFRGEQLRSARVKIIESPLRTYHFTAIDDDALEPSVRGLRRRWLADLTKTPP